MKSLLFLRFSPNATALVGATAIMAMLATSNTTAATYTWTQTTGGSQNWTTAGNWQGGSVPSPVSGDTVDFSTVDLLANTTLTLGATRTATTWKFGDTSGGQTWTVTGNTLALAGSGATIEVGTATSISSIFSVTNGTSATATGSGALTLNNASFSLGGTTTDTTQTLDLTGLAGGFTYNNSSGTFRVSGASTTSSGNSAGTIYLAPTSAITASVFGVGNSSGNANSGTNPRLNMGTVYLGNSATTINANTITLGNNKAQGTVQYASGGGATNPELTLRGSDGTSRVTTMTIGVAGANEYATTSTWDLTSHVSGTSQLDAMIGTLTIGESNRTFGTNSTASVTGSFIMGGGTLDATSIVLGKTNSNSETLTTTGSFTTGSGGTVKVGTLTIGDKNSADSPTVTGTFNLNGGANLYATTIQKGAGTATRSFNWNDGTIHNLAGTDLTIGADVTWTLAATGTRTFDIESGRTGTVNAVLGGSGGTLAKTGSGTLTLNATNTYSGTTTVNNGVLEVSGSGSINNSSGITVSSGAKFVYNSSVALSKAPTLSGNGINNRAVLGGTGPIGVALTLDNVGDVLSPGNSPGIQEYTVSQTWNSFSYDWEVNDFSEVTGLIAGSDFDQISIIGALTLSGGTGSYILNVLSLTSGNVSGDVPNFSEINRSWNIITTTDGITGFDAANWTINTAGFTNAEAGTWGLSSDSNNVILSYYAIPEPATGILGSIGMVLLLRRRRIA